MTITTTDITQTDTIKAGSILNIITQHVLKAKPANNTLFGGELAVAFYFACLYEFSNDDAHAEIAIARLEKVLTDFNNNDHRLFGPYYCNGLSGLLYALTIFIQKELISDDIKEDADLLAAQLTQSALTGMEEDFNDFVHGSFGILHTLTTYASVTDDFTFVQTLLRALEDQYMHSQYPWITSLSETEKNTAKVNFSMSHGQTGLLQVLLNAYHAAGCNAGATRFLKRNIDYIIGLRGNEPLNDTRSFFPSIVDTTGNSTQTSRRLAWCYGDLGNVLLLHRAANFFNNSQYAAIAADAGYATTLRTDYADTLLNTAPICHGTSGVAHIYKTLYMLGRKPYYSKAYYHWMQQTLQFAEQELAAPIPAGMQTNIAEGLPGIGLSIMSYLSPKHIDWGNLLLL